MSRQYEEKLLQSSMVFHWIASLVQHRFRIIGGANVILTINRHVKNVGVSRLVDSQMKLVINSCN